MDPQADTLDFERLLDHLKLTRGFDFTAYKRNTLLRRIHKRMQTVAAESYTDYLDYLEVHPDEFAQLFNTILISVTAFFRDIATFELLRRDIVPALIEAKKPDDPIRVWCAGCASGEECYSLAIVLAEELGSDAFRTRVKIYATDVDEEGLAHARQGTYNERQLEDVPEELRGKYFDRVGTKQSFKRDYRRSVIFGRHDLLDDAPISKVDLLTCRNTLMYFNQEAQAKIISRFFFALREGGFLVLGKAEMLVNFTDAFAPVDLKHRVFRKLRSDEEGNRLLAGYPAGREERMVTSGTSTRLRDIAFDQDPVAQVVVDAKSHLLLANARARDLFTLTSRDIGRPIQDLEFSYKPVELRSAIDDAHSRRHVVQLREVAWPSATEGRFFNVQVTPILDAGETTLGTKIIFVDVTRQHELQDELQRSRQELETAYEELQSTNEELETTNEELQSTVEELETTNEELQSTNEELETMNEALQSTNDKLEGVNQELRQRGSELGRSNVFLGGILRSVPHAVVVVNANLMVELWNETAVDLWGLRQHEAQGKHLFTLDIGLPMDQLRPPLQSLLQNPDGPVEVTVEATNRRGRPVRVRTTMAPVGGNSPAGGIIILMESSERASA